MMTPEQTAHVNQIIKLVSDRIRLKYNAGQNEHGGNLWERPVLGALGEEVTDLNVYLAVVELHIERSRELISAIKQLLSKGQKADAMDALDLLDSTLRSI